ncbi:uncharacterized protein LOC129594643 [Paramacrobiotus metropolitanus]|uniref:uncharacterized protein LOC129594643 n=1 Tax=Paramacrobiotus metropolitanus TaxID=2943436 RepID=UPI0024459408|nr:uncharacterized protein LOC129594643 [Paramacrobiotus metropolitanus]
MCGGFQQKNSVHVRGRDGRLRYGRVVDVTKEGLFVDLLCANRHREFYSSNNCFLPRFLPGELLARLDAAQLSTIPVVVLVPETPSGPWIWSAGEMPRQGRGVRYAGYEQVVVHWQDSVTGLSCTDIIPIDRILCPLFNNKQGELAGPALLQMMVDEELKKRAAVQTVDCATLHRRMAPNMFARVSVQLAEEVGSLPMEGAQTLIKRWNACRQCLPTDVSFVSLVADRLDCICNSATIRHCTSQKLLNDVKRFYDDWVYPKKKKTTVTRDDCSALSAELWREVFSQLDTVTQTRLRTVSATWNEIMDSPTVEASIVINRYVQCAWPFDADKQCSFLMSPALYKRLRTGTRHVVLVDRERDEYVPGRERMIRTEDLLKVPDMIHYVAQQRTAMRLTTLHLIDAHLSMLITSSTNSLDPTPCVLHASNPAYQKAYAPIRTYCRLEDFVRIGHGLPCETLHMVDCVIKWFCPLDTQKGRRRGPVLTMELPEARLMFNGDFGCTLWAVCEAALPALTDAEMRELDQWLTGVLHLSDDHPDKVAVCKTLCATQSSDPRPSVHYRGKKWCCDGLGEVELSKLSRISLHFFKQLALPSRKGWKCA